MVAYSGWGFLALVWWAALAGTLFTTVDNTGGDWARAYLNTAIAALVVTVLNLGAALAANREDTPAGPIWTGQHRTSGTPLQGQTPLFLGIAATMLLFWAARWIPWPGAVLGVLLLIAAYHGVPVILRGREESRVSARRQESVEDEPGVSFHGELPELRARWTLINPRTSSVSMAGAMNSLSAPALRHPFAVMSGRWEGHPFTIADAWITMPDAIFRAWNRHLVTICAVHLDVAVPPLRITLAEGDDGAVSVWCDTLFPELAQQLLTAELVTAMLQADLLSVEFQGRDILVMVALEDVTPDPDGWALDAVEQLAVLSSVLPDLVDGWDGEMPRLPRSVPVD